MVGPDFSFKTFPVAVSEFNQRISVWSKSGGTDAGATLDLDVSFQYILRKADIGRLYNKVASTYAALITTYALDAIKNTAPKFGVDDYLAKRGHIEKQLKANVTFATREMYVDIVDLQLRYIGLTADYQQTKLNAALQVESNQKEHYIQQKLLIEESTSFDVLQIENTAVRWANKANADANLIKQKAAYEAKQNVEQARSDGLKTMLSDLGLTTDEHKASLDYITTLINNKKRITPYVNLGAAALQKKIS